MKKKIFSIAMLGLCARLFAGGGQESPDAQQVILSFVGPETPSAMAPVITAFEAANPGINVEYESVPFANLNAILQTRMRNGGATPDVFTADQPRIAALVHQGFLLHVSEAAGDLSGIIMESSIAASTVDGKLYAFPVSTSSQLLFYNKSLLDQAGLPYPSQDPADRMTWSELLDQAKKAQDSGASWGLMFNQVSRVYQILPLPESLGGGSGIDPDDPLKADLTNDAWIAAMEFYGMIFEAGIAPRGVSVAQTPDLFQNGEVAFWIGGPWYLPSFLATENLAFGVAPHPYFSKGDRVTPTGAWSWGINPNSDHIEEAIAFVKFATVTSEGAMKTAEGFPLPPANIGVFDAYYAQNQDIPGVSELLKYEIENTARIRPLTVGYIQYEELVGKAMEDIRNGAEVRMTLERAEKELNTIFERQFR